MNTETLSLEASLREHVLRGDMAGMVAVAWRQGEIRRRIAVGQRDVDRGLPITDDTIFRIASLTKPITAVAALTLVDDGRITLDDPIVGVAPELADVRVLRHPDGPLDQTVPAVRPISFRDLLTHRSGLTYAEFHQGPIGAATAATLGATIDNDLSPDEWIARLATLPLVDQPGAGFHYGASSDLLGFLIARIEGQPLGTVVRRRVFDPLGMRDTGFSVPPEHRDRRAALTGFGADGRLKTLDVAPGGHARAERPDAMTFESGGQGLWSTAADYLAFARLFVGGGAVDGVRVLRPETCAEMMRDQLTPGQRAGARMFGQALFARGHGYGMGVAVVIEPESADPLRCRGGLGTVGWPGAYGSWWQADPTDESVLVFLTHNMVELTQMAQGIGLATWSAIAAFHALGLADRRRPGAAPQRLQT
ncbi:MAG: serine hydrolase domain-containing protein [Vicinamibacterales bacterium]